MSSTATDNIDGISTSVAVKAPCIASTTEAITLFGLQTIDSVVLVDNDRVLVKDQANAAENGLYNAHPTAWTRCSDFDGARDAVTGTMVIIHKPSENAVFYRLATEGEIVIGTTELEFEYLIFGYSLAQLAELFQLKADAVSAVQADFFTGLFRTVDSGRVVLKLPYTFTITETVTRSESGTCDAEFAIDGVPLGGDVNAVSSTEVSEPHTTNNVAVAGQDISITISNNAACESMSFGIIGTRLLGVGGSSSPSSARVYWAGLAGGTGDAIELIIPNYVAQAGDTILFEASADNSAATTVSINGGAPVSLTKFGATALAANDIRDNAVIGIINDGNGRYQLAYSSAPSDSFIRAAANGNIGAGTLRAQIAELDDEKLGKATGGTMTADVVFSGAALTLAEGSAVASAATLTPATDGNFFHVTGAVGITAIHSTAPSPLKLVFDSTPTLTHNATSLILPGGANIVAQANDTAEFVHEGGGNWRCVSYTRANGAPLIVSAIVQVVRTVYSTVVTTAGTILPLDNSIPQSNEGDELAGLATTITPKYANSNLLVECSIQAGDATSGANYVIGALFRDAGANAIGSGLGDFEQTSPFTVTAEVAAGSVAATTFKVRVGTNNGVAVRVNAQHDDASVQLGGTITSIMKITEIVGP